MNEIWRIKIYEIWNEKCKSQAFRKSLFHFCQTFRCREFQIVGQVMSLIKFWNSSNAMVLCNIDPYDGLYRSAYLQVNPVATIHQNCSHLLPKQAALSTLRFNFLNGKWPKYFMFRALCKTDFLLLQIAQFLQNVAKRMVTVVGSDKILHAGNLIDKR